MIIRKLKDLGIFYKIMGISVIMIVFIILWNLLYFLPQVERIMMTEKQNAVKDVWTLPSARLPITIKG